jgi:hypothetical protein
MCLYYDEKATKEILERAEKGEKEFVFFKVFRVGRDTLGSKALFAPFQHNKVYRPAYASNIYPGDNKNADFIVPQHMVFLYETTKIFSRGIHVHIDRKDAITAAYNLRSDTDTLHVIKLVKCHIDDFVAAGKRNDAVFTKVEIINFNTECDILKLGCPA